MTAYEEDPYHRGFAAGLAMSADAVKDLRAAATDALAQLNQTREMLHDKERECERLRGMLDEAFAQMLKLQEVYREVFRERDALREALRAKGEER